MRDILSDFSNRELVKTTITANWENYHYCLGRCPSVELSIGKYLTWLITDMPDHFMNLVICTEIPRTGLGELIDDAYQRFKARNVRKLTWLAEQGVPADELKKQLIGHDFIFSESYSVHMAADLTRLPKEVPAPVGLSIVCVEDLELLKDWIHVASVGFGMPAESE